MPRIKLADEMIECAAYGHQWQKYHDDRMKRPQWGMRRSWQCVSCTATRHYVIDSLGRKSHEQRTWPEGYSYVKDERPSRQDFRREDYARDRRPAKKVKSVAARKTRTRAVA